MITLSILVTDPSLGCQCSWVTHLTLLHEQRQVDGTLTSVTGSPALTRTGIWCMAIGAQRLAVDPRLRNGVNRLFPVEADHFGDDGGAGYLDQDDVIKPNSVERVLEGQTSLNFVGHDHAGENVANGQWRLAVGDGCARQPVTDGQDSAEVVTGMAPLGCQPAIIEVKPSDLGANVEGSSDWVLK